MKIIFMGTPDFSVPTLNALIASSHEVVLVVTGPDKPRGRGQKLQPTAVKEAAVQHKIPVYQPEKLQAPEVADRLQQIPADLFVVVAFRILPEQIFSIPPQGTINLHASLLPKYRGAAPIQRAILNGDCETGVTTFFIEKNVDTGIIILQRKVAIASEDTAGVLHDRLAEIGAQTVCETVDLIAAGKTPRLRQTGEVTKAPKITREMCRIEWSRPAEKIINQIRAFSPFPGAFTYLGEKLIKIYRAGKADLQVPGQPGDIYIDREKLFCKTGSGWLEIFLLQLQGKKRLPAKEFLPGFRRMEENTKFS
ncbi:MAG TPA: methionyl-tRNA formyltransferase [Bacteroidetes bacterium]|nr:methionyl-tRNA formyltransferase [Bacteroidota bacterium]